MSKIVVNVFNTTMESKDYITCIEMPKFKQMGRTINYLREYVKLQSGGDSNHYRIRYYIFQSNTFVLKEADLSAYNIG